MAEENLGGTPTPAVVTGTVEKTYSKLEVESMIASRVARIKEGKEAEEAQRLAKEKYENLAKENEESKQKLETYKQKEVKQAQLKVVNELGVDPEFSDYVNDRVEHGENDETFKANVTAFLVAHPRMKKEGTIRVNSNPSLSGGGAAVTREQLNNMSSADMQAFFKSQSKK